MKTDGPKLLLDLLKLIGISQNEGVPNYRAYSNFNLTKLKYITYKHSREEYLWVMKRIRPKGVIYSENT
jgi:hypothetical protein